MVRAGARMSTSGESSTAAQVQARLEQHRFASDMLRARSVLVIGFIIWLPVGLLLDVAAHGALSDAPMWQIVVIRFAASAYHALMTALMYRSPLPPRAVLEPLVRAGFVFTAVALAALASQMGGFDSPYGAAMMLILIVQALAMPSPWRDAALPTAMTVCAYPIGLFCMSLVDPGMRAEWQDETVRANVLVINAVIVAGAFAVALGGHIVWTLRQSVFESRSIGRYRLVRRIGKGGMGEVWRAHDRATRRDVALKVLSPEYGRHPGAVARFEREIGATAALDHPHTVGIYDWGVTDDGVWYYAMELLHGADLATLVARRGPLPPPLVAHLGAQAARALVDAHGRGVIHRDIKPANLFVVADDGAADHIKILDFGVASVADETELTVAGAVIGTPAFMAPEVAGGGTATSATDAYGLAASMFHALTGQSPRLVGGTRASALAKIPVALDDALAAALATDPAQRPSCAELAARFDACSDGWRGVPIDGAVASTLATAAVDPTVDAGASTVAPPIAAANASQKSPSSR